MGTNQNFDMSCSFSVGCGVLVFDHQNCILCAYITVSFEARKPPHHTHRFIEQSISFFIMFIFVMLIMRPKLMEEPSEEP